MGLMAKKVNREDSQENVFWTTMSDLMLGLAIVFMTLFVLAITGFTSDSIKQKQEQMEINKQLIEKLAEAEIEAQVDPVTGDIKISDLELFEVGSYNLSPKGRAYLDKFAPIYVDTIFSNVEVAAHLENIIIQGHTDSQSFAGIKNSNEQYMRNMTLSLQRANSVADYIFHTNFNKQHSDKLKQMLVVEGKSYSEPVIVNGKEDYQKSRRVEMRLKTQNADITKALLQGLL